MKKIRKRTVESAIVVRGKTKKGAKVSVSVNGQIQQTLIAGRGGKYATTVGLSSGLNTIRVLAGNSKGSKSVVKRVVKI